MSLGIIYFFVYEIYYRIILELIMIELERGARTDYDRHCVLRSQLFKLRNIIVSLR